MPLSTTKYVWPSINEFSGLFDLNKKGYVFILTLTLSDLKSRIDLKIQFKSKLKIEINIFTNLSTKSIKAIFVIFKNNRKIGHWVSYENSGRRCPGWNRDDVQREIDENIFPASLKESIRIFKGIFTGFFSVFEIPYNWIFRKFL